MKLDIHHAWLLFASVGLVLFAAVPLHIAGLATMKANAGPVGMLATALFGLVIMFIGILFYSESRRVGRVQ